MKTITVGMPTNKLNQKEGRNPFFLFCFITRLSYAKGKPKADLLITTRQQLELVMLNWDDFNADDAQDTHAKTQGPQAHEEASKDEASTERFEVDGYGHEEMVQIQDNILRNMKPVRGEDKRMIGGTSDINQLVPFGHVWAWEKYLNSCANHWMPTEINMSNDIAQWKSDTALTEDERRVIKHCLGFFSTADTIVGNNCMLAIYPYLTSPEARQFIQRQSFEEAMHCFIDGTEILTEHGFVDFRDLQEGVKVAQYHEEGGVSFVVPSEIIRSKYQGEVVSFKGDGFASVVTPNHRCVGFVQESGGGVNVKVVLAGNVDLQNFEFIRFKVDQEENGKVGYTLQPHKQWNDHGLPPGYNIMGIDGVNPPLFKNVDTPKQMTKETLQYEGEIHCVTVPTGMVVVRYGDCVTVSGNSHSYQYCIESMGLNQEEIFSLYHHSPAMRAKAAWCLARTKAIQGLEAKKNTIEGDQEFLEMLIAFYVVMEGIFFYCGFPTILSMGRRGKMTGVAEQFQYILRDECLTADTEVLTPDGWIPITQVTYDTSIVQWDKSWGLSYAKPEMLSMTDVDYTYEIKDTRGVINKRVSGNHRIPHMKQGLRSVQVCTADELIPSSQITLIGYDCKNQLDLAEFRMTYAAGEEVFKTRIDEPTTVYGIQVPSSFILIRREGVVSVTGNSNHLNFGIDVINQIKIENPHLWTPEFQARAVELIRQGTMLEINFARDLLPRGVLGMNATLMEEYLKFIANRRLVQLGLPQLFEGATNPFPWMAEMIDLTKEKNFFETRLNNAA